MKLFLLFLALWAAPAVFAQSGNEKAIRRLMQAQTEAWNQGNIDAFMNGYWKNDSLVFIGKSGVTYGWNNTLANYKKGYPDTASMGKLTFRIISVKRLSTKYYFVIGQWFLKRSIGDIGGHYTLLFRKINGRWAIIADHSS